MGALLRHRARAWPAAALLLTLAACGGSSSRGGSAGYTYVVGGTLAVNEGSAAQPIGLTPGTAWTGMVGAGTSYYRFTKASGGGAVVQLTPDNTQPVQLQVLLTDRSDFAAICAPLTQTLSFAGPGTSAATFTTGCGGGLANGTWYLAVTQLSGPGTDYALLVTTP